jgi:hypothetical protein
VRAIESRGAREPHVADTELREERAEARAGRWPAAAGRGEASAEAEDVLDANAEGARDALRDAEGGIRARRAEPGEHAGRQHRAARELARRHVQPRQDGGQPIVDRVRNAGERHVRTVHAEPG